MFSFTSKFPLRVRIFGGEFDASARAMHRKAAFENVSTATIERKSMSTKTTFKRVALVAVAAVAFGGLTAVSASAAATPAIASTAGYVTHTNGGAGANSVATAVTGGFVGLTIASGSADKYYQIASSGVGTLSVANAGAITTPDTTASNYTNNSALSSIWFTGVSPGTGAVFVGDGVFTFSANSAAAGTQVITVTGNASSAITMTITWGAAPIVGVLSVANSKSFSSSATTAGPIKALVATVAVVTPGAGAPAAVGGINVTLKDTQSTPATINGATVSATVSGAGLIDGFSAGNSLSGTPARVATSVTDGSGQGAFVVYNDGTAGIGTINIYSGSTLVATHTFTFSGTFASYKVTAASPATAYTSIPVGSSPTFTISGLDASGNAAAIPTTYVSSSDVAVATVAGGNPTLTVTAVAAGKATITIGNAVSSPTISTTLVVNVGKVTAKTVTIATDKSGYSAGEKITLTITATGSDGTAVGDGARALFDATGIVSNVALQGLVNPGTSVTLVGGVATLVFYAPLSGGTVSINAVEGAATDSVTKAAITTSFDVSNPSSDAATDAANAATDAANYAADAADAATTAAEEATAAANDAADAAQAAQESADAATAAVVELSTKVSALIDSLRAQITSLGNYVAKVAAALGRVGTALNKVLAKK